MNISSRRRFATANPARNKILLCEVCIFFGSAVEEYPSRVCSHSNQQAGNTRSGADVLGPSAKPVIEASTSYILNISSI